MDAGDSIRGVALNRDVRDPAARLYAVLVELGTWSNREHGWVVEMAERRIADKAGRSPSTITKALTELTAHGLVLQHEPIRVNQPTRYVVIPAETGELAA